MPVPTSNFRDPNKLHLIFAVSAVVLFISIVWLVMADYSRDWRGYQRQARVWQVAMTKDAQQRALTVQGMRELHDLEQRIDELTAELPGDEMAALEAELGRANSKKAKLVLPAATVKGEIGPKIQQLERARLAGSDVNQIERELTDIQEDYRQRALEIAMEDEVIANVSEKLRHLRAQATGVQKEINNLTRTRDALTEKLEQLDPQGGAKISHLVRNAPLLDWFNPSEKVQQVVVPDIRTDLNFLTVETIDRCTTCHVNIDNPAFEETNLLLFIERQVASYEGQDVDSINHPVVLRGFWESAAKLSGLETKLTQLKKKALGEINGLRSQVGKKPLSSVEGLASEFDRIVQHERGNDRVTVAQWQAPLGRYLAGLKRDLLEALGDESFKYLRDLYRYELTERFNAYRGETGLPLLSSNPVMLGHPQLDMYVGSESFHPVKTMGCTSCHEGSGQETDFLHTAHMPRDIWVDAHSGVPIPAFLVDQRSVHDQLGSTHETVSRIQLSLDGATPALAANVHGATDDLHGEVRLSHADIKLTDLADPAPFAPKAVIHASAVAYKSVAYPGQQQEAVRQSDYWREKYHWHAMHYMEWEKPMHRLEYIESSCNKCHTEIFDIKDAAPKLFEGRLLFSQMGCANCHAVDAIKDDLDVKQVGPSLAFVKHKLSADMIASWIWSPKAFRPTTKMPHYFMLENNSSPVDILRTRTEVAAITHYLMTTKPAMASTTYEPEPVPEGIVGDTTSGRKLFNSVGCLACHSNLDEYGQEWIVDDLISSGLGEDEAIQQYERMTYNQQHWYVMEHLPQKFERTGPELSGVGTKLKAGGRTEEEAFAWLYDWLRNPRHYSSYTVMPSFRLSEQEASDLAAYLLSLDRPGYQPAEFLKMNSDGKKMLAELVAQLKAASSTLDMAREKVSDLSYEDQLSYLGGKMIGHYGCNNCHQINGFEEVSSACAELNGWGTKDPHMLDFGYFDHAFDKHREAPTTVWKVDHEGVAEDAPQITRTSLATHQVALDWEHLASQDRRPWLYHKLHNPRVYDRGRTAFEGYLGADRQFNVDDSNVGKPYDKLKMPKFFLNDSQVDAIVTFVTSVRKPLVNLAVQQTVADNVRMRVARGRQIATLYNCYGCHNIEGNQPQVWEYFDVFNPNGSYNYENLNNAPPRLIAQGAKTQPQWLHQFLQNVYPLRPWLKIRMPSFYMDREDAAALVDYFAGVSQDMAGKLSKQLEPIEKFKERDPDNRYWFEHPSVAGSVEQLESFGVMAELVARKDLDQHATDRDERAAKWEQLYKDAVFHRSLNDISYPYVDTPSSNMDEMWFARGEATFTELRCYQCHALGDEDKLFSLWELDNPDAGETLTAEDEDEDDGYGYEEEEDDYGYDDEGEEDAVPLGPVYTAPNLSYTAERLQWNWVDAWLQEPATIQPGTKMPQWFPGGRSAFANYPGDAKQKMHANYGYTGADQRRVLLDFLYTAGRSGYTPGEERLTGAEPPKIELAPLPKPVSKQEDSSEESVVIEAKESVSGGVESQSKVVVALPVASEEPEVSSVELHDEPMAGYSGEDTARIVGEIRFEGKPARRKPIRMGADPYCSKAHDKKILNESMIVTGEGLVKNVFVYVKSGVSGKFTAPQTPFVMDQVGCMYRPHVAGVMAGQPLLIKNSDNTLHNVKMNSSNNGSFNEGMPVKGMVLNKVLSKPEMGVGFKCDVHPWMSAYLYIMRHPFFSVSDVEGRFEIVGLPPGTYTLEAIHESKKILPVTFEITVAGDTSYRMDVTLKR